MLSRDHVIWAHRILLDREPECEDAILQAMRTCSTSRELRAQIVTSDEYQDKNPDFAHANERNLVIKELDGGVRLVIDLADHAIGLNILRRRFELNELDFARRTVKPGQHVIDAGAHIGFFAMHMAADVGPSGTVHCFEPLDANADCLQQSVRENGFEGRVVLERAALGARTEHAELVYVPRSLNSGGAFIRRPGAPLPHGHASRAVRTVALDTCALQRPVSFIKIDVEGAEPLALAGAARLVAEDRPVILSELHPVQLQRVAGSTAGAFIRQVNGMGYRCHLLGAGVPGLEIEDALASGATSVVFVPR